MTRLFFAKWCANSEQSFPGEVQRPVPAKVSLAYVVRRHISLDFLGLLVRTPGPVPSALSSSMNFHDVFFSNMMFFKLPSYYMILKRLLLCLLVPICGYSGRSALARGEETASHCRISRMLGKAGRKPLFSLHTMFSKRVSFGC